jgi:hypothetical protein
MPSIAPPTTSIIPSCSSAGVGMLGMEFGCCLSARAVPAWQARAHVTSVHDWRGDVLCWEGSMLWPQPYVTPCSVVGQSGGAAASLLRQHMTLTACYNSPHLHHQCMLHIDRKQIHDVCSHAILRGGWYVYTTAAARTSM